MMILEDEAESCDKVWSFQKFPPKPLIKEAQNRCKFQVIVSEIP